MVSYYNPTAMYRHQQAINNTTTDQFHTGTPMHSWYPGYHPHQGGQMAAGPTYCMQEEQMWAHPTHQTMFHNADYHDFVAHSSMQQHQLLKHGQQLPSPSITVSESEISSPGGDGENITPPQNQTRPTPARSPFEWIKKSSYQVQGTCGKLHTLL